MKTGFASITLLIWKWTLLVILFIWKCALLHILCSYENMHCYIYYAHMKMGFASLTWLTWLWDHGDCRLMNRLKEMSVKRMCNNSSCMSSHITVKLWVSDWWCLLLKFRWYSHFTTIVFKGCLETRMDPTLIKMAAARRGHAETTKKKSWMGGDMHYRGCAANNKRPWCCKGGLRKHSGIVLRSNAKNTWKYSKCKEAHP